MFYTFNQNNSGGWFDTDAVKGIARRVIVEAGSHYEANRRAEDIGLYFDGCASGIDCSCCGDRWYEVCRGDGDAVPSVYSTPLDRNKSAFLISGTDLEIAIHYLDGSVDQWWVEDGKFRIVEMEGARAY